MDKIPVIINNRDILTWTKKMVDKIKTYDNVSDIIILDNASTYKPLLDWYETKPCEIIRVVNGGHTSPWSSGLIKHLNVKHYIVTDPDLGIDDTPNDTVNYLLTKLSSLGLKKIGLGLEWELTPANSPYFKHIIDYEKKRIDESRVIDNIYIDVHNDTTFALYSEQNYFIGGGSTSGKYRAKHYPWYMTNEERESNEEFMYYIKNASNSSSYKNFLNL